MTGVLSLPTTDNTRTNVSNLSTDVIGNITSGAAFTSPSAFLGTIVKGANTINNAKKLTSEGLRQESYNILTNAISNVAGVNATGVANTLFPKNSGAGQNRTTAATSPSVNGNGALPAEKVNQYFASRPGALDSLAKSTVFQKEQGLGSLNDVNAKWNSLTPAAKDSYKQQALNKVINGDPSVQAQYNTIRGQL